jgi:hypothetical protein
MAAIVFGQWKRWRGQETFAGTTQQTEHKTPVIVVIVEDIDFDCSC